MSHGIGTSRGFFVLVLGALVACSSSSSTTGGGSDSGKGDGADAFVDVTYGGNATCNQLTSNSSGLVLGMPTAGKPTTVTDGAATNGGTASVACTVHPDGTGFDVQLSASLNGDSITITSPAGKGVVTAAGGLGLQTTFVTSTGTYVEDDCSLTFTYMTDQVPVSPPVAAGRIWGHVQCPTAALKGQSSVTCEASADFLFEQCGQ
jgi:hypothetical protein